MNSEDIKEKKINLYQISPKLLRSVIYNSKNSYNSFNKGEKLPSRYTFDFEFHYFLNTGGYIIIDSKKYSLEKGNIVFLKPGQFTQGIAPYKCYHLCVDLKGNSPSSKNKNLNYKIYEDHEFQPIYHNYLIDAIDSFINPRISNYFKMIFENIHNQAATNNKPSNLFIKSDILKLISLLYQEQKQSKTNNSNHRHYETVMNVVEYIKNNLHDENLNLVRLAQIVSLSPNYLHSLFSQIMKKTINDFITSQRINKAKKMLASSQCPIYEVAQKCGYSSSTYFSYVFKKEVDVTPSQFRKKFTKNII